MKKYIKLVVTFFCTFFVLAGCNLNNKNEIDEKIYVDFQHQVKKMPYTSYFQKEIALADYEPGAGAYLGAYVLANPEIEFDISQFEKAVGKNMAVALRHYQLGDPFPDNWLLKCIAEKKTPHIVITPNSLSMPYDQETLEETALKFKDTYGIPVFIEFYPNPKEYGDPISYTTYFKQAREIFSHHAPNTIFVWSVDLENVYDSMLYYPGDDYVDWVGLWMYLPIYKDGKRYNVDINENLTYFYNAYQSKKPIMISKLAISHYSKIGHTFYVDEAIETINHLYSQLPIYYPRIKGINYIDIDNIKMAPNDIGNDNFSVSTEPKITKAYKKAISRSYYLEEVKKPVKNSANQWIKMRMPIYSYDDQLYILEETLVYDWEIKNLASFDNDKVIIGGNQYYPLDLVIKKINYQYTLNNDILHIYKK